MPASIGFGGYDDTDPLNGVPPQPNLRPASPNSLVMPKPSADSLAALTGSAKIQSTMMKMHALENLVREIVRDLPGLANVAEPFITQMRDMGAAALADQAQGGMGSAADSSVPAPLAGAGGIGGRPGGPGGGGPSGPGPMPMPPM